MNCEYLNEIEGLQFMPIHADKSPIFQKWQITKKKYDLSNVEAVGLVCGNLSGNLEVIDFDLKYDLTKTLMARYKELVSSVDDKILKKLVWQKTRSGGYHAIYRCEKIEGNRKLAQREANEEEKADGDKINVLIETRGEGGQIAIAPTVNYSLVGGTLDSIPTITIQEREILINCAISFNEYFKPTYNPQVSKMKAEGKRPLDDYDERGDCVGLLVKYGWKIVKEHGAKILLQRPGSTSAATSGNFDRDRNWFSVFTTSSQFDAQKAYKPSGVYAVLECNGDFHEAAKRLLDEGYGEKTEYQKPIKSAAVKAQIEVGDESFDYVATAEEMESDLIMWRNGTFPMGLTWGIPELDEYHLLKRGQFNIINGRDNVGKSTVMWYLATVSACLHNWHWVIFSSENKFATVKKRCIEFYWGEHIQHMNEAKYNVAKAFIDKHFSIIKCNKAFTYVDVLNMVTNISKKKKVDGLLIDPYNSLIRKNENGGQVNVHDYDYEAASIMQIYMKANDVTCYINCHAISSALRNKDENGEPAAPLKDDTEGGGKWAAKADDFLTGHRLVGNKDKFRLMQIYVRKVKETETGGKVSPFTEPVILEMYGHYGFRSQSGVDPIANFHSRPTQTELPMEEPKKSVTQQPSKTWTDSQSVKEQNENHFETDELDAKNY